MVTRTAGRQLADDTSDNVTVTMPPATNKVPGLEDDEDNDQDDSTDSADDGDEDGGTPAPMDAMATFASSLDGGLF